MKGWKTLLLSAALLMALTTGAYSGGPWSAEIEGDGIVSGGDLPDYGVIEAEIGWNFKWNKDTGEVKGQLNIVEKLYDGGVRHFKLFGYEVYEVGKPLKRPILFDCDNYQVRVQGRDEDGREIAMHLRSKDNIVAPNSIWYWVKSAADSDYISNSNGRLPVSNLFWMECR
jgi:hypothetical protein